MSANSIPSDVQNAVTPDSTGAVLFHDGLTLGMGSSSSFAGGAGAPARPAAIERLQLREVIWEGGYELDRKALTKAPGGTAAVHEMEACVEREPRTGKVAIDYEGRAYFVLRRGATPGVPPLRLFYRFTPTYTYLLALELYDGERWCGGR